MTWLVLSATTTMLLDGENAIPNGLAKLADVLSPSALPMSPLPASVVTTPPGYVMSRMRLLSELTTTIALLEGTTATPVGPEMPSDNPASVATTPEGVTKRIRLFAVSATTITPSEGTTATPLGELKLADVPAPSAKAASPLPASVVTTPPGYVTSRM